jgi:integrase
LKTHDEKHHLHHRHPRRGIGRSLLNRFRLYSYWRRACRDAGVTGLTQHDLRATFSTRKTIFEGHDRKLVMAIIGDTTDKAFNGYVRPKLDDLKRVMVPGVKVGKEDR